jgi:phosphoglycerate dehydrogenase-like enzyme
MAAKKKINLLVNLPPSTFTHPDLEKHFNRLSRYAVVRKSSHNKPDEIHADTIWANAIIMWAWPTFDEATLQQAKELKWVGQINTGRTIAERLAKYKIALSESRHCWSPAVAEMALTLILAGLRRSSAHHIAMRAGTETWDKDFPADINPNERELSGRSVGIVGFGGIGQRLAKFLRPFEVDLRIHDPFLPARIAKEYNAKQVPVLDLVKKSDVVVLCAANTQSARHIMGAREINALRKNAILVNVGRSYLVDMPALQARLAKNNIVAMLDVFEKEPLEPDSPLRALPNTFLTPHRAGGLLASVHRAFEMLIGDLENHLAGKPLHYEVTKQMWPTLA